MIAEQELFERFCEALPETLELNEQQKKKAFEFIYKICYVFIMEDNNNLFKNN